MSKQPETNIEKASDGTLTAAVISGHHCGSEKTVKAATDELIRRTTF